MSKSERTILAALIAAAAAWCKVLNGTKPRTPIAPEVLAAYAAALANVAMPLAVHQGSAADRREWCRQHGAPVLDARSAGKVGKRADVSFRATLARHAEGIDMLSILAYQPVYGTNSAGVCDPAMYLYRVGDAAPVGARVRVKVSA